MVIDDTELDIESIRTPQLHNKYLDADTDLSILRMKVSFSKEKVGYLESVVKIINNRQWNIRSAIDWRKFVSGA